MAPSDDTVCVSCPAGRQHRWRTNPEPSKFGRTMLTIWGRRSSFNLQKVMWLAGELELPHTHIPADGDFGLTYSPEFLAMNPHGRVPVIDDDGTIVWESQTILRYLAAKYGRERFWSEDRKSVV